MGGGIFDLLIIFFFCVKYFGTIISLNLVKTIVIYYCMLLFKLNFINFSFCINSFQMNGIRNHLDSKSG